MTDRHGFLVLCFLSLAVFFAPPTGLETAQGAELFAPQMRRVLFLGDSITFSGQYIDDVEAYYRTHFTKGTVEFINAGLGSETVSGLSEPEHLARNRFARPDLHERLERTLAKTRPDLVFLCYGMNDGIYLPLDEGRFQKFREGMAWAHGELVKAGAKVILITPPVFDEVRGGHPGYTHVLDVYSKWMIEQKTNGWEVVDIHFPMKLALADGRLNQPDFAFASDGIHPGEEGHWLMARLILTHLGAADVADKTNVLSAIYGSNPNSAKLLSLVRQRQVLLRDALLADIAPRRPVAKGLPMRQASAQAAELDRQMRQLMP